MKALVFLLALSAFAADHYVLAGATGAGTGADWTNAYTALPATLTRGDTYYIGTGTYSGAQTLDDAASGTTVTTIMGATVASHGTSTGWSDAFSVCATQAQFPGGWDISTGYWTVDGACGGGSANNGSATGYGFRRRSDAAGGGAVGFRFSAVSGITVAHYEIDGVDCCSIAADAAGSDGMICTGACNVNATFSRLYIHDIKRAPLLMGGNITLEYSYIARNRSTTAQHAEGWSYRGGTAIIRWNIWEDIRGTGQFVQLYGTGTNHEVYGNVFRVVQGTCGGCNNEAHPVVDNTGQGTIAGLKFYHNTVYGLGGNAGAASINGSTGYDIKNNLWYGSTYGAAGLTDGATASYNIAWGTYLFSGPATNGVTAYNTNYICGAGANCLSVVGNNNMPPDAAATFISAPANLHPRSNTVTGGVYCNPCSLVGTDLGAPYNVDMDGKTRIAGGATIGAYQFGQATTLRNGTFTGQIK